MDLSTAVMLAVFGLMAANQLVMRVGGLTARPLVFWSLQVLNLVGGTLVIWFKLPGLEQWPVVSWFVGLMFFLRSVQNNQIRADWLRERIQERSKEKRQNVEALRDALEAGERARVTEREG